MDHEPLTPEQKFEEENGMTLTEAWEKVREWNFAGQFPEARRGCEIIVEYFPEHPAKNLLIELSGASSPKSLGGKLGTGFVDSVEKMLKRTKGKHASPKNTPAKAPSPVSRPQPEPDPILPETPVLDEERIFATIGYAWIFCIIPLLMKRDSVFVQFHAKQGLIMALFLTIFDFTIGSLLNIISGGFGFVLKLIYIGVLAFAAYRAYQGKYWKIPIVYDISKKIKL